MSARRKKCHAKTHVAGVDLYSDGFMVFGMTHREAIELHRSLSRQLSKIRRDAKGGAS